MVTKGHKGFVTLIGMIVSLIIIGILIVVMLRRTVAPTPEKSIPEPTRKALNEQGILTSQGYTTMLDNTRSRIDDINKQTMEKEKYLERW